MTPSKKKHQDFKILECIFNKLQSLPEQLSFLCEKEKVWKKHFFVIILFSIFKDEHYSLLLARGANRQRWPEPANIGGGGVANFWGVEIKCWECLRGCNIRKFLDFAGKKRKFSTIGGVLHPPHPRSGPDIGYLVQYLKKYRYLSKKVQVLVLTKSTVYFKVKY